MGFIRNSLITGLSIFVLTGCGPSTEVRNEYKTLHEDAVVEDVIFIPSRHGSSSGVGYDLTGEGGLSITSGSVSIPEKYAVVFKCKHGKFIVQAEGYDAGTSNDSLEISVRDLWKKISKGDTVDVLYRELYECTYKDTNNDGKLELISSHFIDYDFLDANKKK
jgi:hypothetical protein